MTNFCSKSVPAWTLILSLSALIVSMLFGWMVYTESQSIKSAIRFQESKINGFIGATSILSPRATCERNVFIGIKDWAVKSDTCSPSF